MAWADGVARYARSIVWGILALSLVFAAYAALNLGVNADNMRLLDPNLPFQRAAAGFQENFTSLDDSLLIVIDARSGTQAQAAADQLVAALSEKSDLFTGVFEPGAGGSYKQLRGFDACITRSAHFISEPRLASAIEQFLEAERDHVGEAIDETNERSALKPAPSE